MIAHRDIKLENVLLRRSQSNPPYEIVLTDFGLSKTNVRSLEEMRGEVELIMKSLAGSTSYMGE